jgi:hypothetical protein
MSSLPVWSAKVAETIRRLVTRPGALTCDVLAGDRARAVSPLGLCLACGLVYFVLAAGAPNLGSPVSVQVGPDGATTVKMSGRDTGGTGAGLSDEDRQVILDAIPAAPRLLQPLMRRVVDDLEGFERDLIAAMPKVLVVLLPVFVAILTPFYPSRHFTDHVYFALHLHAFIFLAMSMSVLIRFTHSSVLALTADAGALIWISVYVHLSFRRVYGESQIVTMLKETMIGVLYSATSIPAIIALALWVASR